MHDLRVILDSRLTIGSYCRALSSQVLPAPTTMPWVQLMTVKAARTAAAALYPAGWIIVIRCSTVCQTLYTVQVAVYAERHCMTNHFHMMWRCRDHIAPVPCQLHWLPIREHIKFKVACLVCQLLSGQAPLYLADDCCLMSDSTRRSLRSADVSTCLVWIGVANTQQLRRQNFSSCATSPVELFSGPAVQSRHV